MGNRHRGVHGSPALKDEAPSPGLVSRSINTVTFVASTTASSSRSDDDAMSVTSWRRSDKEIDAVVLANLRADGRCGRPLRRSSSPMSLHRLLLAGFMHRFLSRSDESADLARRARAPACGSRNAAGAQRTPDDFVAAVENLCIIPATSLISPRKPHQQTSSYLWSEALRYWETRWAGSPALAMSETTATESAPAVHTCGAFSKEIPPMATTG